MVCHGMVTPLSGCSSVDGLLDFFLLGAITNKEVMNIALHSFISFFGYYELRGHEYSISFYDIH